MRTLRTMPPTPEQLPILADDRPGFRLIRGAAGSGKTTTALMRLKQLCTSRLSRKERLGIDDPVRVLVLTFNRTLRGYIRHLIENQVGQRDGICLTVDTFARWARRIVGTGHIAEESDKLKELLQRLGVPAKNMEYFSDEVNYVMGRFHPARREAYLDIVRTGRGGAPAVPRKLRARILNEAIQPYEEWKSTNRKMDWNDLALRVADASNRKYDVVVVDESQDLSANQIRAVLAHLNKDHVTTFIIDAVQRIYPQSFLWRELDIRMRPQMVYSLKANHRNTREIARFAASLVRNLPPDEDGLPPDDSACPRSGQRPRVIVGKYEAQIGYMLNSIAPFLEADETVAVLHTKGGGWFDRVRKALRGRDIGFCELTRERDWPEGPELVALSTVHSAKGLEFDHVLIPGLNREVTPHGDEDGDGRFETLRRLIAMGVGRARHTVMVGCKQGEQSAVVDSFDPETYDRVEV